MHTQNVTLTIPEHYLEFWEKIRGFYGLPEGALDQVVSEQFIHYINMLHDDLASEPVIGGNCDLRKSLEV